MLRPERMSKVSVTGAKSVMDDVIETMHDLNLVHITDYDGSWEGFEPGDSLEGADETSSRLVTVRALENTLDLDEDDIDPASNVDLSNAEERLEEIRQSANELDDRRDEQRTRLREIDEQLDQMSLFADLGLDLDLLWGYDTLDVLVGEGNPEAIEEALDESDDVEAAEVFTGSETGAVAVFARMAEGERIEDALVGVSLTTYEVPEMTGDPESNVAELQREREQVETKLDQIENELEQLKLEEGAFLLALEEELTIEAQKTEAPLRFATTERSFIIEGWIPSDKYEALEQQLRNGVGDRVEIAELLEAEYTSHSGPHKPESDTVDHHEESSDDGGEGVAAASAGAEATAETASSADEEEETEVVTDGGQPSDDSDTETGDEEPEIVTDGGHADDDIVTVDDDPPVIQKNSKLVNPFEILVEAVNRPKYSEFDPTITLFLTFPLFFGFMIGDIGYGLLYVLIGYGIYSRFDSEAISNFGAIVSWLGLWTMLFGVLYGEVLGLHFLTWFDMEAVIHKGISETEWAITWLIVAVIVGWLHLNLAYIFNFVEELQLHGFKPAMVEVGSWLLMLNGLWVWIFSYEFDSTGLVAAFTTSNSKPAFLVGPEALLAHGPLGFGFEGFPAIAGVIGLAAFVIGISLLISGPWYEAVEFLVPLAHTLSYTRITAVLLAKAGMALAANLLYFGAYHDDHGFHFMHAADPADKAAKAAKSEEMTIIFDGLFNMGPMTAVGGIDFSLIGAILGLPVLIAAHIVVLAVGGTAAIQAIRLEYFEFFEKFYEGGGKKYEPFGHERKRTTDD
jgi:V/A-type H+-transporting ATPase subunit I